MTYETIQTRVEAGKVGVVTLHRPRQLNALNDLLLGDLGAALQAFDAQESIGCLVLTGSEKAFAAGGDIADMPRLAAIAAKGCVNRAFETGLSDGACYERRPFHALFATADQKEGRDAFIAKRKPDFRHR